MEESKQERKSQAWGIASLVASIFSVLLFLAPYFGLPLAIFSIVASGLQKKIEQNGYGTAGLITGIIGVIINSIMTIFFIIGLMFMGL